MPFIHDILKKHWGFSSFRPLQEDIINCVLSGKDALALMPTGGGKSLCYQVPALANDGLCLVISPLIALMKDQVENLRKKNITAFAIWSGMSRKEVINTLKVAGESNCKFLYVSPERLETSLFKEYLPGLNINLVAVDEAHCISQWGYDFRPPYLRIAALRHELSGIPFLALTASATPEVQKDIIDKLEFGEHHIFRQSFERPALSYSVYKVQSRINKITEVLQQVPGSSIVYCKSRRRTKEISDLLQLQDISALHYHAGLPQDERSNRQEAWIAGKVRVIVCTNAFGMGIDKPDVRTVIHADAPDCLENYYQEAGRAGRDGKKAYAVLLYDETDLDMLEEKEALRFPSLREIKEVYQSVANYLQVPAGGGQGQYYDFDMSDFLVKFKLPVHTVLYSLKALEQDGWLSFNEQVFLPATVSFTISKNGLHDFELKHPALENCIKSLLRAYGGIFDQAVPVSEKAIAAMMRSDANTVIKQLLLLHQAGVIDYRPQKDSPQLYFNASRVRTEELTINMEAYNKRKEQYRRRLKQMLEYINEKKACRSQHIGAYFGDNNLQPCGICDNCLRKKDTPLTKEEFDLLHRQIINILNDEPVPVKKLLAGLGGINKEKAWQVIEFLQAENKIKVDKNGAVSL